MKRIRLEVYAFGKINLSLDVLGKLDNGYHQVKMVMQQIQLHDQVLLRWLEKPIPTRQGHTPKAPVEAVSISLSTSKPYLPTDQKNLAYQAAQLMIQAYGQDKRGSLRIDIKKHIPVAAGLAGGSSNAAAVLHGLNFIWDLKLNVSQLCHLGGQLGADVPFSIMGQAKANPHLALTEDPLATHCALATGIGDQLEPLPGLKGFVVLTKPPFSVSTQEVYQGLDLSSLKHPADAEELIRGLKEKNFNKIQKNMQNALESFTLIQYPAVKDTKNNVEKLLKNRPVLMSGSGPTIYALCPTRKEAQNAWLHLRHNHRETYWTKTTY